MSMVHVGTRPSLGSVELGRLGLKRQDLTAIYAEEFQPQSDAEDLADCPECWICPNCGRVTTGLDCCTKCGHGRKH